LVARGVAPGFINIAPLGLLARGGAPGYINIAPLGLKPGSYTGDINIAPLLLSSLVSQKVLFRQKFPLRKLLPEKFFPS
jgi:hypothetical protein